MNQPMSVAVRFLNPPRSYNGLMFVVAEAASGGHRGQIQLAPRPLRILISKLTWQKVKRAHVRSFQYSFHMSQELQ